MPYGWNMITEFLEEMDSMEKRRERQYKIAGLVILLVVVVGLVVGTIGVWKAIHEGLKWTTEFLELNGIKLP